MADKKWTKDQQDAISAKGGTVLVSAAAGSGKTAVLVERVIKRITDKETPCDSDRFLIVTFSNAAAAEMKERISAKLRELIEKSPNDSWLLHQRILLDNAHISTIHSFCMQLLRENFQQAELFMDFRIGDENELGVLKADALSEVVESYYNKPNNTDFLSLVELLSGSRDDKKLASVILKLYTFILSHPFPEKWLEEKLALYNPIVSVEASPWGKVILEYAKTSFYYCVSLLNRALADMSDDDAMEKAYMPAYQSDRALIVRLINHVEQGNWDDICNSLQTMSFDKLGTLRNYEDTAKRDRIKALRDEVKTIITYVKERVFCSSAEEFLEDIADLAPKIACLFDVVMEFNVLFTKKKREKNLVDFNDLEHLTLKLLVTPCENGYKRTAKAEEISHSFAEILLDEYQDTNEAQDMIFKAVSIKEKNLFMVGDVKQSIYRFRQAMPEIFIKQKDAFSEYTGENYPSKIILSRNFRSRKGVTQGINFLFGRLMSKEIGEIVYDESEYLYNGAEYPESNSADMAINIIDLGENEDEEDKLVLEARHIAKKIADMMQNGFEVFEKDALRPAKYSDFCILLRSVHNKAEVFANELIANNVPCYAESTRDFLQTSEIKVISSFLRALNNPLLDIPLLAVLMSPVFCFSADDAARIRMASTNKNLYHGVVFLAESGDEKCRAFLSIFADLRRQASMLTADKLISKIYDETDMTVIFSAMKDGEERELNLYRFVEYAAQYEGTGYRGVQGFVRFIDNIAEHGGGFSMVTSGCAAGDRVRVMSIHHSKGLEFPVCFLADTAKKFNKDDLRGSTALHSELGFACVRRESEISKQYTTVNREAVLLELERSMLSEELRVLYVALTRAKEKLIITMALDNVEKKLTKLSGLLGQERNVPEFLVRRSNSYAEWILAAVLIHKDANKLRELCGYQTTQFGDDFDMDIKIVSPVKATVSEYEEKKTEKISINESLLNNLKEKIEFHYSYQASTQIPAKLSVSQIAKKPSKQASVFAKIPAFLSGENLSATQKGTAIHTFMQFSNYDLAEKDTAEEISRLYSLNYITKEEAESISVAKLKHFFASPLYSRMKKADKLYRELKFFSSVKADEFTGEKVDCNEQIVVQGIADCVFVENGTAILVDYKSDKVYNEQVLIERYTKQLFLYKKAIEEGLAIPVLECILYSFEMERGIQVETAELTK